MTWGWPFVVPHLLWPVWQKLYFYPLSRRALDFLQYWQLPLEGVICLFSYELAVLDGLSLSVASEIQCTSGRAWFYNFQTFIIWEDKLHFPLCFGLFTIGWSWVIFSIYRNSSSWDAFILIVGKWDKGLAADVLPCLGETLMSISNSDKPILSGILSPWSFSTSNGAHCRPFWY